MTSGRVPTQDSKEQLVLLKIAPRQINPHNPYSYTFYTDETYEKFHDEVGVQQKLWKIEDGLLHWSDVPGKDERPHWVPWATIESDCRWTNALEAEIALEKILND